MIATPAVDLKDGHCVQLVGGRPEDERVSLPDPVAETRGWHALGYESLHVVDLDAALDRGDNLGLIRDIVRATPVDTQVGGGVRGAERVASLLEAGADRVIVGTLALAEPAWLRTLAATYPGRLTIALDTRDGRILRKGWTEDTGLLISEYLPELADIPLAGVLSTDVGREGRMEGIDRDGCRAVIEASPHPVWISGGITTIDELEFLDEAGATGVVLGMALYTDKLDRREVAERWGRAGEGPDGPSAVGAAL